MTLGAEQVGFLAMEKMNRLMGLRPSHLVGIAKEADGWKVTLEAVTRKAIPDSCDILAVYEVYLDDEGNLGSFSRIKLRKRGDTD